MWDPPHRVTARQEGQLENVGDLDANSCGRPIATNHDPMTIGFYNNLPTHEGYRCGEPDELILLDRALTSDEIHEMHAIGVTE